MVVEVEAELTGRTLAEFEAELMGQLRMQLGPVVWEAVTEVAGRVPVGLCPSCGGRRERRGRDGRQVVGLFGAVWLQRSRVKCLGCGMSGYPADEQLGLEAGERYTLGVAEAALWVATENSYAKAAGTTKHLLGVEISHGQIHRLAQREGELVDQALEEQRETVFGLGKRQVLAKLAEQGPRPERVVVQADGTFVNDRATGSEMEAHPLQFGSGPPRVQASPKPRRHTPAPAAAPFGELKLISPTRPSPQRCAFRVKSATDSGANRPAVPAETGHPFRSKPAT